MKKKLAFLLYFLIAVACLIVVKIIWIQFVQGDLLAKKITNQFTESRTLQTPRGTIYDRNGQELAVSCIVKSLYVNPKEFKGDSDAVADKIAFVLGLNKETVKSKIETDSSFIWIKRMLEPEEYRQVSQILKETPVEGFFFIEESKRYYPNDFLAAHVLGFVGADDKGLDGIEMMLDSELKEEKNKRSFFTDNRGVPLYNSILSYQAPHKGKKVYLTLDSTIQFIAEKALDSAMATTKANGGTVIVMNPKTGAVLAMASRPTYNPNEFYKFAAENRKNRAISIIYEPGSTFKSVVAAAALQDKKISVNEVFVDKGYIDIDKRFIKNWSGESYGTIPFVEVVKNSVNTCFVQIGLRVGAQRLTEYAKTFGFGKQTGIDLPGEEEGILFGPDMTLLNLATMSIGQGIAVTPIQLVTALSSIANGGNLVWPHVVEEIQAEDGTVIQNSSEKVIRQTISPETSQELSLVLEKVVSEGGGQKAKVAGYHIAGKTGTAEKLNENGSGYLPGHYIASFAGFGPVEDPQIAILVMLDDPSGVYYGGQIAAPVAGEIFEQVFNYLNIAPTIKTEKKASPQLPAARVETRDGKIVVPSVMGKTIREVSNELIGADLGFIPEGTGIAVDQDPKAQTLVLPGQVVKVIFRDF